MFGAKNRLALLASKQTDFFMKLLVFLFTAIAYAAVAKDGCLRACNEGMQENADLCEEICGGI